jgi:hypothetical protein
MVVKRKLNFTPRSAKKSKFSRAVIKRTNFTGDIIPRNLNAFGSTFAKPTGITRVSTRYAVSSLAGGTTTGNGAGYVFALSSAPQYANWQAVFDQYRIVAVEVDFMPYFNVNTTSAALQGRLFTCIDYDDGNTPLSAQAIRDFPNCIITPATRSCTRTLVPHVADALYAGAFTSFGNKGPTWIDSASPSVQHYAVKAWAENSATTSSTWYVEVRMFIEFRNPRLV